MQSRGNPLVCPKENCHNTGPRLCIRKLKSILLIVDRQPTPALLPILRSQQQGEILALLLGDPDLELSLTEIAARTGAPHASVHREIERAEQAGLVVSRKLGNTRLVRANTASPYYAGLAEILTRAFGVPAVLAEDCSRSTGSPQPTSTDRGPPGTKGGPGSGPLGT